MIQPESGPVYLFGTEFQKKICWEIVVAGSEQGIEAGQVGLKLITKGERQTTVAKEWSISAASIADGRCVLSIIEYAVLVTLPDLLRDFTSTFILISLQPPKFFCLMALFLLVILFSVIVFHLVISYHIVPLYALNCLYCFPLSSLSC